MTTQTQIESNAIGQIESKLGRAKGKERSRVWLEGSRLEHAGFTVGARYSVTTTGSGLSLSLDDNGARKVSGKGSTPIIDMTGKAINARFGRGDTVLATFYPGHIAIDE